MAVGEENHHCNTASWSLAMWAYGGAWNEVRDIAAGNRSAGSRFAAIGVFIEYSSYEAPSALALKQSLLAIPMKCFERPLAGFLSRRHIEAILVAPYTDTLARQHDSVS